MTPIDYFAAHIFTKLLFTLDEQGPISSPNGLIINSSKVDQEAADRLAKTAWQLAKILESARPR
jgi:hypothetical protein